MTPQPISNKLGSKLPSDLYASRNFLSNESTSQIAHNPLIGDSEGSAIHEAYRRKYKEYAHGNHLQSLQSIKERSRSNSKLSHVKSVESLLRNQ